MAGRPISSPALASLQSVENATPDRRGQALVVVSAYVLLFVLGALEGLVGCFHYSGTLGSVPAAMSERSHRHGVQVARTYPRENPGGKVTETVAVELANVPASAGACTVMSGPLSEKMYSVGAVPTGILLA